MELGLGQIRVGLGFSKVLSVKGLRFRVTWFGVWGLRVRLGFTKTAWGFGFEDGLKLRFTKTIHCAQ